jgi:acyl carrier protein
MNVYETVKKTICAIQPGIDEGKIKPEALLKEDLEIDSLSKVEMSLSLEEQFNLNLQDTELEEIKTVGHVVALIESKLKVKDAA